MEGASCEKRLFVCPGSGLWKTVNAKHLILDCQVGTRYNNSKEGAEDAYMY